MAGLAAIAGPATAGAATPPKGKRFDGQSQGGARIYLRVNSDGRKLSQYTFAVRIRCSDGRRRLLALLHPGEGPARIDAAGNFGYRSKAARFALRGRGGRIIRGRIRTTFEGSFVTSDVARGTLETNFRSRRLRCVSGRTAFEMYRDGTPKAPYRNKSLFSGRYRGSGAIRGGRGIKGVVVRVFAPAMLVQRFYLHWEAHCRSGVTFEGTERAGGLQLRGTHLSKSSSYSERGRRRVRLGRGYVSSDRYSLRMRLFEGHSDSFSGETELAVGTWRLRSVIKRRGRRIDTCRVRGGRFAAAWDGTGPR